MSDPLREFKDVSIVHFGDNAEQKFAAEQVIDQLLGEYGDEGMAESIPRVGEAPTMVQRIRGGLYTVCLLLCLVILGHFGFQVYFVKSVYDMGFTYWDEDGSYFENQMTKHLNRDERIILFGDQSLRSETERYRALWDLDITNPAYYFEYAMAYQGDHGTLPPDFIEYGEEIDPGNGWYAYIAAGFEADRVVVKSSTVSSRAPTRSRRSRGRRGKAAPPAPAASVPAIAKPTTKWHVNDEAKYTEVLRLYYAAAEAPRFQSNSKGLVCERLRLLNLENHDYTSRLGPIAYIAGQTVYGMKSNHVVKVLRAEAERCGLEKNPERLKKLLNAWKIITERNNNNGWSLIDGLLARAWIHAPLEDFRDAAVACGLNDEADRLDRLHTIFDKIKATRRTKTTWFDDHDHKLGVLHRMALPMVGSQVEGLPEIGPADAEPGRMADHVLSTRIMASLACLVFMLSMGFVALYRFWHRPLIRKLALAYRNLLSLGDWAWIVSGGLLLPVGLYLLINYASPWSARDLGVHVIAFYTVSAQFACMGFLVLMLVPLLTRWRWRRRAKFLGFAKIKFHWIPIALLAVAMPLSGVGDALYPHIEEVFKVSACFIGVALTWLLAQLSWAIFAGGNRALTQLLMAHSLLPVYTIAATVMAVMIPLYHLEEKQWVAADDLLKISADEPGVTPYEYRVTEQLRIETRDIMKWDETRK